MRARTYQIIIFFLFSCLLVVLFFTQIIQGRHFYDLSLKNFIRLIQQEPYRGRIYDRNGNVIVDNVLSFDVVLIPQEVKDKEMIFKRLSNVLSIDEQRLLKNYKKEYLNAFKPVAVAKGVSKTDAIRIEESRLDLPGVAIELNSKRFYPYAATCAHVVGHMGEIDRSRITQLKEYGYDIKDKVGICGIEERYDIYMRGEKGGQQIEVDSLGRQVRMLGFRPPIAGKDIQISIDLELQQIADRLLEGKKGAIVVMDVSNGEIIVMSSAPAFNPNIFIDRNDKKALNYVLTSGDAPLFNRAISGQFPPGSVFKAITALAAFKEKKMPPSTTYVCPGKMKIGNRYFKCWSTHDAQDFYQAMAHSCDVYFYHLGLIAGVDAMSAMAHDFGLGGLTGIDLSGEADGFVPSRMWKRVSKLEGWYDGDTANFSIGQGYVLATPLQIARLMAAFANGGYLVEPHLIRKIGDEEVKEKAPKKIRVDSRHLKLVKESLRLPVSLESGTAHNLDIKKLEISGKTGTAQVSDKESHGWIAGFFPQSKPRYAFCVLLENIGSSHYASEVASQLFEVGLQRKKFLI
ncbi:MAG: penicillin-binding protein 2 [Candidatus Omnitrophota bacterium]